MTMMKKMIFALMAMMLINVSASAMSYEQARREALFLTDKMAYELNLTDAQYEAAYEINLDYLMSVTGRSDVFGTYWERRNLDLSYVLLDWQWSAYLAAKYFYRPLYWEAGYWHFGIYLRYPHRDYFYFGRPHFYATYRGGHSWHHNGGHSFYHGHQHLYRTPNKAHVGMHDRWQRGEFHGNRQSSTRVNSAPKNNAPRHENGRMNVNSKGQLGNHRSMTGQRQAEGNRNFEGSRQPNASSSVGNSFNGSSSSSSRSVGNHRSARSAEGGLSNGSNRSNFSGSRSNASASRSSSSSSRSSFSGSRSNSSSSRSSSFSTRSNSSRASSSSSRASSGGSKSHGGNSRGGSMGGRR